MIDITELVQERHKQAEEAALNNANAFLDKFSEELLAEPLRSTIREILIAGFLQGVTYFSKTVLQDMLIVLKKDSNEKYN